MNEPDVEQLKRMAVFQYRVMALVCAVFFPVALGVAFYRGGTDGISLAMAALCAVGFVAARRGERWIRRPDVVPRWDLGRKV